MPNENLTLLYDLMRQDLRARGLDESSINARVADAMQYRLQSGIGNETLAVTDVSNLSQESLEIIATKMYSKTQINSLKDTFLNLLKLIGRYLWKTFKLIVLLIVKAVRWVLTLNAEAKLGFILLIPPFFGIVWYFFNTGVGAYYGDTDYKTMPVTPIYLGLMAIAGSYLVKGNLHESKKRNTDMNAQEGSANDDK